MQSVLVQRVGRGKPRKNKIDKLSFKLFFELFPLFVVPAASTRLGGGRVKAVVKLCERNHSYVCLIAQQSVFIRALLCAPDLLGPKHGKLQRRLD